MSHFQPSNPIDRALCMATPVVAMPHHEPLPPVQAGEKRFIVSGNGVFVEASSKTLHAVVKVADGVFPFAENQNTLSIHNYSLSSRSSAALLKAFVERSSTDPEIEFAAAIVKANDDEALTLAWPQIISRSSSHIRYVDSFDEESLVIDVHSHGRIGAFFSTTDDEGDCQRRGPYLAVVIGNCHQQPQMVARLVLPPYLIPVPSKVVIDLLSTGGATW